MAQRPNLYKRNYSLYPEVYARTSGAWQSRVGRRNREQSTFINLLGLNTAFDDFHKRDGESPYLRNVRYMGEKQTTQRAQATSRSGAKLLSTIGNAKEYPTQDEAQNYIEMFEGRAIEFDVEYSGKLVGGMLYLLNTELARGIVMVHLKANPKSRAIAPDFMTSSELVILPNRGIDTPSWKLYAFSFKHSSVLGRTKS